MATGRQEAAALRPRGSHWSDVPPPATHDGTGETEGWPEESWHLRLSSSPGDSPEGCMPARRTLQAPAALATRGGVAAARHTITRCHEAAPFALSLLCGGTTARESAEDHVQPIPRGSSFQRKRHETTRVAFGKQRVRVDAAGWWWPCHPNSLHHTSYGDNRPLQHTHCVALRPSHADELRVGKQPCLGSPCL